MARREQGHGAAGGASGAALPRGSGREAGGCSCRSPGLRSCGRGEVFNPTHVSKSKSPPPLIPAAARAGEGARFARKRAALALM